MRYHICAAADAQQDLFQHSGGRRGQACLRRDPRDRNCPAFFCRSAISECRSRVIETAGVHQTIHDEAPTAEVRKVFGQDEFDAGYGGVGLPSNRLQGPHRQLRVVGVIRVHRLLRPRGCRARREPAPDR
jgi:hypothetical protein